MLSAGTLLCVHASFPFLVNVVCGGHICSHCGHIWFCHVCGFGGILRRAEHGEVLYVPFGVFVLQLTYRSLCFEQLFVSNSERFKYIYNITVLNDAGLAVQLSQQMYSKFSFWFGINLQGIFGHFR